MGGQTVPKALCCAQRFQIASGLIDEHDRTLGVQPDQFSEHDRRKAAGRQRAGRYEAVADVSKDGGAAPPRLGNGVNDRLADRRVFHFDTLSAQVNQRADPIGKRAGVGQASSHPGEFEMRVRVDQTGQHGNRSQIDFP